jgi:hypothetical protein
MGMDTSPKLYYWFAAYEGKKGSAMYTFLQDYFFKKNIILSDDNLSKVFLN